MYLNNSEKILAADLLCCPTGGLQFHLKNRIFNHFKCKYC